MILINAKMEEKIVHYARFTARWSTNGVMEYARNSAENAKDMLMCNPARLHWSGSCIKFHVRS